MAGGQEPGDGGQGGGEHQPPHGEDHPQLHGARQVRVGHLIEYCVLIFAPLQITYDVPRPAGRPPTLASALGAHGYHGDEDGGGHGLPLGHGDRHSRRPPVQARGQAADCPDVHPEQGEKNNQN